jgi:Protein of unknown function (DUF3551)
MPKLAIGLGVLAAIMAAPASASVGGPHPWCLIIQDQDDGWACGFDTFEQCRVEARSGNTGFCAANPFYQRPEAPNRPKKRRVR